MTTEPKTNEEAEDALGAPEDVTAVPEQHKVGYGQPPMHTRFQKGQSGNPKGRPKGSRNISTHIERHLDQKVTAKIDGKPRKISNSEAIALRMVDLARTGNLRAILALMERDLAPDLTPQEPGAASEPLSDEEQAIITRFLEAMYKGEKL
jgi:hypothetical protein